MALQRPPPVQIVGLILCHNISVCTTFTTIFADFSMGILILPMAFIKTDKAFSAKFIYTHCIVARS